MRYELAQRAKDNIIESRPEHQKTAVGSGATKLMDQGWSTEVSTAPTIIILPRAESAASLSKQVLVGQRPSQVLDKEVISSNQHLAQQKATTNTVTDSRNSLVEVKSSTSSSNINGHSMGSTPSIGSPLTMAPATPLVQQQAVNTHVGQAVMTTPVMQPQQAPVLHPSTTTLSNMHQQTNRQQVINQSVAQRAIGPNLVQSGAAASNSAIAPEVATGLPLGVAMGSKMAAEAQAVSSAPTAATATAATASAAGAHSPVGGAFNEPLATQHNAFAAAAAASATPLNDPWVSQPVSPIVEPVAPVASTAAAGSLGAGPGSAAAATALDNVQLGGNGFGTGASVASSSGSTLGNNHLDNNSAGMSSEELSAAMHGAAAGAAIGMATEGSMAGAQVGAAAGAAAGVTQAQERENLAYLPTQTGVGVGQMGSSGTTTGAAGAAGMTGPSESSTAVAASSSAAAPALPAASAPAIVSMPETTIHPPESVLMAPPPAAMQEPTPALANPAAAAESGTASTTTTTTSTSTSTSTSSSASLSGSSSSGLASPIAPPATNSAIGNNIINNDHHNAIPLTNNAAEITPTASTTYGHSEMSNTAYTVSEGPANRFVDTAAIKNVQALELLENKIAETRMRADRRGGSDTAATAAISIAGDLITTERPIGKIFVVPLSSLGRGRTIGESSTKGAIELNGPSLKPESPDLAPTQAYRQTDIAINEQQLARTPQQKSIFEPTKSRTAESIKQQVGKASSTISHTNRKRKDQGSLLHSSFKSDDTSVHDVIVVGDHVDGDDQLYDHEDSTEHHKDHDEHDEVKLVHIDTGSDSSDELISKESESVVSKMSTSTFGSESAAAAAKSLTKSTIGGPTKATYMSSQQENHDDHEHLLEGLLSGDVIHIEAGESDDVII